MFGNEKAQSARGKVEAAQRRRDDLVALQGAFVEREPDKPPAELPDAWQNDWGKLTAWATDAAEEREDLRAR